MSLFLCSLFLNLKMWVGCHWYCYENETRVIKMINKLKKTPKTKIMRLFAWSTNKQKYSNNISIKMWIKSKKFNNNISINKRGQRSKHATTTTQVQRKQNAKITISNLFTFIEISRRQRGSPSSACIRLFNPAI